MKRAHDNVCVCAVCLIKCQKVAHAHAVSSSLAVGKIMEDDGGWR